MNASEADAGHDAKVLFSETQRFRQWWLWTLLILLNGLLAVMAYTHLFEKPSISDKLAETITICAVALLMFILTFGMLSIKLETRISSDRVSVCFYPIQRSYRHFHWQDITSCYIRDYSPIGEYGGWGFRGSKRNRALNIDGSKGIQLQLKNGNKLLIGTQRATEADTAVKSVASKLNNERP